MDAIEFASMPIEDVVERLRIHGRLLTGYALALAERSGLDPTEAADLFILPLLSGAPSSDGVGSPDAVQHWLEHEAAAMGAVHGRVRLGREREGWRMAIAVTDDLAYLRPWGVPTAYWLAWLSAHLRQVAVRHGVAVTVTLDGDELLVDFAPES